MLAETESQNVQGWKGPLWVIQSNPPAEAGSPTAGCTGPWGLSCETGFVSPGVSLAARMAGLKSSTPSPDGIPLLGKSS